MPHLEQPQLLYLLKSKCTVAREVLFLHKLHLASKTITKALKAAAREVDTPFLAQIK